MPTLPTASRYLNARSTLRTLVALGVVPVINENDTVVTDEIRVGDNDTLAALVDEPDRGRRPGDPDRPRRALHRRPAQGRRGDAVARRARGRPRARRHGRRCGQHDRSRRHADESAGGEAGGAQRRAHGDRIGPGARRAASARRGRGDRHAAPRGHGAARRAQAMARGSRPGGRAAGPRCGCGARACRRRQEPAADRREKRGR